MAGCPSAALPRLRENDRQGRRSIEMTQDRNFAAQMSECLHDLIQEQAERAPARVAVRFGESQLTYGELAARSDQLARHLHASGVSLGKLAGICMERSLEMMIALLGVLKSGAAYVPIDPAYPAFRQQEILAGSGVSTLISQGSLRKHLAHYGGPLLCMDEEWQEIAKHSKDVFSGCTDGEDRAYVIFTSGSTGRPKGVQIQHRAVVNLLTSMRRDLSITGDDVLPALASLSFDMCIPEIFLPLVAGGTVIMCSREIAGDGEQLWALMRQQNATIMQATPSTWSLLIEAGFYNYGMRIICGAEPLPREVCARILTRSSDLYNFYGPTETTVWSTFDHLEAAGAEITVGYPIQNTQVYVLDQSFRPVPPGETGEVFIAGTGLALGYLNQADLTAERFLPNPFSSFPDARMYRTLDMARHLPDGRLQFMGRADRQIKIRGFRIELEEIEGVMHSHAGVREAAVGVYENGEDKRLVAYVVGTGVAAADLRQTISDHLPDYMVPAVFIFLERLPRLPNGKVDRGALPIPDRPVSAYGESAAEADTETEEFLKKIWEDVLRLDKIGIHDDFFMLGGHSLLATQVVSRVRNLKGIELPLQTMFNARTIAQVALEIERLASAEAVPCDQDAIDHELVAEELLAAQINEMSEAQLDALLEQFPTRGQSK